MQTTHHGLRLGGTYSGLHAWSPQKEACHEAPPALTPATSGESANLYFHSTLSQDLGHIFEHRHSAESLVFARVALSPLTAAPGAQLKPRAYPLSTPAGECQTSSRLRVLVGVSAVQFYLKYGRIYKRIYNSSKKFLCAVTRLCRNFIFQPKPGNTSS